MSSITVKATKPLIRSTFTEVMDEPDLVIAKTSVESNLKLLDGMLHDQPKDRELLELAAMGYFAYSIAFVEDDSAARAMAIYERSKGYAARGLATFGYDTALLRATPDEIASSIERLPAKATPFVFWFGLSSAMRIMLAIDNTELLADLPRVENMMQLVRMRDSTYFYGGAPLFFGVMNGFRPKILGGNPELAEREFDLCRKMSNNQFQLERVFRARYLYVTTLEEEKFRSELNAVLASSDDVHPGRRLLTAVAKNKARRYLANASNWF